MRKLAISICKNKDGDQLCGNHATDQCLCFRYIVQFLNLPPPCCVLEQDTLLPESTGNSQEGVTEKLLTGAVNLNTNKQKVQFLIISSL